MSIFNTDIQQPSKTDILVSATRNQLNGTRVASKDVAQLALSTEGLSDDKVRTLLDARAHLSAALESISLSNPNADLNVKAGTFAAMISADPVGFLSQQYSSKEGSIVGLDSADQIDGHAIAAEAYDETVNNNLQSYSVVYNMLASRQDDFGEAFFPTVTISPDQTGIDVSVRILNVINDKQRDLTGKITDMGRKNVLRAYADSTILKNDMTKAIPIFKADRAAHFVSASLIPSRTIKVEGEDLVTAPLAVGATFDLISLSQRDAQLALGQADITDSLHPSLVLDRIYAKVGDDVLSFRTKDMPLSTFISTGQDLYRMMTLNFNTNAMLMTGESTRLDGSPLTTLQMIKDNNLIVRIRSVITGNVELAVGQTSVYGNAFEVFSVKNADGETLSLDAGVGATVVAAFAGAKIIGYDLTAYLTNSNRANRGQLVYIDYFKQPYSVPAKSPLTAIRPVMSDANDETSDLSTLVTVTNIRTSNSAVTSLIEAANLLNEYVSVADAGDAPAILGVSRFLVLPYYRKVELDVSANINSLSSHERADDIVATLLNNIRDNILHAYTASQYKAASNAVNGGEAAKPTITIGTDPIIHRYLMLSGDVRTLSEQFNVNIVETLDYRVSGKMYITFTTSSKGTIDPLNFGNMLWAPELVFTSKMTRNGRYSFETSVSPRFTHIVNLPILIEYDVSGITDSLSKIDIPVTVTP